MYYCRDVSAKQTPEVAAGEGGKNNQSGIITPWKMDGVMQPENSAGIPVVDWWLLEILLRNPPDAG